MIDKKWIGHEFASSQMTIERGRLQFFAKAIGETNPIYFELESARQAGYADLPVPPTFLFGAELDSGAMFGRLNAMEVPLEKILHGEQKFEYFAPVVAGETVTLTSRISNVYDKKNGTLEFIETESTACNERGEAVAQLRSVIVVRH